MTTQRPFLPPPTATEVVLVRHGACEQATRAAPVPMRDGQSDGPLTAEGREQAQAVAAVLPDGPLFASTLRRTQETAAPLAARLERPVTVLDDLREVHLGDWEPDLGGPAHERAPSGREVFASGGWDLIPGAERGPDWAARVARALDAVADAAGPGVSAVAFTHGAFIAQACRMVTGSEALAFIYHDNGAMTRLLRLAGGRWALRSFNETAHLRPDPAPPAR